MIFRWDTIKEVQDQELQYQGRPVPGKMCEIELVSGATVQVWRSNDGQWYFCHGLTFGGKGAPGGAISPYTGRPVEVILQEHYQLIPEAQAQAGGILVWKGVAPETTPHSAILTDPVVAQGKSYLDDASGLRTKNGLAPEASMTLAELIKLYGESYNAYTRR
jgi:hypothetical protein